MTLDQLIGELIRDHTYKTMAANGRNQSATARELGIPRSRLKRYLKRWPELRTAGLV